MNYFNKDLLNETTLTFYDFPQEALYFKQLCIFELTRLLFKKLYIYPNSSQSAGKSAQQQTLEQSNIFN